MLFATPLKPINSLPTLRRGNSGEDVKYLQNLLKEIGLSLTVDGIFGERTELAVKKLQANHNLRLDGIVGSNTWNGIYFELRD